MLIIAELRNISEARLEDAKVLWSSDRFDGAVYLCGYAIEMALKATICETLRWEGYPSTGSEFRTYQSFRTHDLDVLLHLSGVEGAIKTHALAEWSRVAGWDPEIRYNPIGRESESTAQSMVESTAVLLSLL